MMLLLRWVAYWPLWLVQFTGALLGWIVWAASPTYRRRLAANAARAGLTPAQRRAAVAHAGRMSAEVPWLWFRTPDRLLAPYLQWDNEALVEQAIAAGKGLLLLTPHLGAFEFAARGYAERYGHRQPVTVLYRPARQARIAQWQTYSRTAPGMQAAPANLSGVRQMLRALRKGETVGLLPDQVPPEGQGVWAPFFGQSAYTMTLAARLVQQTGCIPLLTWTERLPHGRGFINHYRPFQLPPPEAGEQACAAAVNEAMAWVIGQCPTQYLWGYNRFKQPRRVQAPAGGQSPA